MCNSQEINTSNKCCCTALLYGLTSSANNLENRAKMQPLDFCAQTLKSASTILDYCAAVRIQSLLLLYGLYLTVQPAVRIRTVRISQEKQCCKLSPRFLCPSNAIWSLPLLKCFLSLPRVEYFLSPTCPLKNFSSLDVFFCFPNEPLNKWNLL